MMSFIRTLVLLLSLLSTYTTIISAQTNRCATTVYGPIAPQSLPYASFGMASNLINLVPVTLTSPMTVAAVGIYPWATQSAGLLNFTCGLYSNTSVGLTLLSQAGPVATMDLSKYASPTSINPLALYFQPPVSAAAGDYVVGYWWTWTGPNPFSQAIVPNVGGVPTTQAVSFISPSTNTTLNFTTSNGQLPSLIAANQQFTEIVSVNPGILASVISPTFWCASSSSSSTATNSATDLSASSQLTFITMTIAGLSLLALVN